MFRFQSAKEGFGKNLCEGSFNAEDPRDQIFIAP